mmetsp:Transcript_8199/g.19407  ORF Transcript_8199/g.19407 Transcript_8199/m.19407 type:complete len:145 (+) Transcript_8199:820-1254(+)
MDSRSLELSSGLETKESRLLCSCSVQLLLAEVQLPLFEKQEVPFLLIGCSAGLRRWQAKWGQEEQEQEEQDEQAVILHNVCRRRNQDQKRSDIWCILGRPPRFGTHKHCKIVPMGPASSYTPYSLDQEGAPEFRTWCNSCRRRE